MLEGSVSVGEIVGEGGREGVSEVLFVVVEGVDVVFVLNESLFFSYCFLGELIIFFQMEELKY